MRMSRLLQTVLLSWPHIYTSLLTQKRRLYWSLLTFHKNRLYISFAKEPCKKDDILQKVFCRKESMSKVTHTSISFDMWSWVGLFERDSRLFWHVKSDLHMHLFSTCQKWSARSSLKWVCLNVIHVSLYMVCVALKMPKETCHYVSFEMSKVRPVIMWRWLSTFQKRQDAKRDLLLCLFWNVKSHLHMRVWYGSPLTRFTSLLTWFMPTLLFWHISWLL